MNLNNCIIHTPTQQDYYDVLEVLLDNKILSEHRYNHWVKQNYYTYYKEEMSLAISRGQITYSALEYHTSHTPWKDYEVICPEDLFGTEPKSTEPFIKTISIEDIYKSIKTEPNT